VCSFKNVLRVQEMEGLKGDERARTVDDDGKQYKGGVSK
jgi:hypothetical protein